ncbi:HTH-type transcriptional regulator DmlR [Pigmentiphaga humi]|uniref:HTH-type transcriptional regulator DmlR n=1 Tax=Pigmentiphaga humi TaxID=2478468 RepID=A0A3P4AZY7_9BURK|nr:LysR family transcriptional regulator [Pigmentiphaga humi]VCU69623.1 HTH-type transcriptional regulator DmlR [Pigmentiphaga humi]
MNKLLCMHAFARVAESSSVATAGEKLGLSASAVAKCIARLEGELGVQLVARTTRAMRLTDLGEVYYRQCRAILAEIEEGEALLKRGHAEPDGTLALRVPAAFGQSVLMPGLARFQSRYPKVQLRIRLGDRPVDLLAEGLDMAVVTGPLPSSTCIARTLAHGRMVAAASPDYLARHGVPTHPSELPAHRCITMEGSSWSFVQDGVPVHAAVRAQASVDSELALRAAALGGAGIIHTCSWTVGNELRSGALVAVLEEFTPSPIQLMAVCAPQRYMPGKMRAMLDFLHGLMQEDAPAAPEAALRAPAARAPEFAAARPATAAACRRAHA